MTMLVLAGLAAMGNMLAHCIPLYLACLGDTMEVLDAEKYDYIIPEDLGTGPFIE